MPSCPATASPSDARFTNRFLVQLTPTGFVVTRV
jgi:hypothetical protein